MLLNASNLTFSYTDAPVLRDVNVILAPAEVVALIGPNGSGKSTLLKALAGHLRTSGSIEWEGKDLRHWPRRALAKRVAYLPQSPTADPEHRVINVLRLGRSPYWSAFGIESPQDAQVIEQIARDLGLEPLLDRRLDELSGGQRQRIFIARCLVQQPAAMLLDEPTTFLDLRHQVELLQLLKKLSREQSIGILMASHDVNLASAFADRMMLLDGGAVAGSGKPRDVMQEGLLSGVYGTELRAISTPEGYQIVYPMLDTATMNSRRAATDE